MTDPKCQPNPPTAQNQSLCRTEDTTREGHYQPVQMRLSVKPPAKSKSSTHLGITIRWWATPPRYLAVADGAATADCRAGGIAVDPLAPRLALAGQAGWGGDAAC
jgi:hypothetical protein